MAEDRPAGQETTIETVQAPQRLKPSLKLDPSAVVRFVTQRLTRDLADRNQWNLQRIERYAKLRGWLPEKTYPIGALSSNMWVPTMLTASMRLKSSLENAVKSTRPLMEAKATQRRNIERQENISNLIDFQVFEEANGENLFDDFISNLVDDGTAVAFVRWVREDQILRDVKILPGLPRNIPADVPHRLIVGQALDVLFDKIIAAAPKQDSEYPDYEYDVVYEDQYQNQHHAIVCFYDTDQGKLEAHITQEVTSFDGPSFEVLDLEDIVVPARTGNLQPPTQFNPHGAPYVNRLCKTTLDTIRRLKANGTYDLLDDAGMSKIASTATSPNSWWEDEAAKLQKDQKEGVDSPYAQTDLGVRFIIEHYGRWDVDGDGFDEDVVFWVERDSQVLLRARLLGEIYPGVPVRRPFGVAKLFPIPGRFYAQSLGEILEPLQDAMKFLMDSNFDWGTITNIPFGFYRPASGLKREDMTLLPGTLYPVDRPTEDVSFPTWNRDMSWVMNTFSMLKQMDEKLSMQSDVQFGRVPTGQASALRTLGTTASLLQQGDARSEQILRRLFHGISEIYLLIHRLNRRYLPKDKQIRVMGMAERGEDPYVDLTPDRIDADVDFAFRATMLNTNKQVVAAALGEVAALLISPIALQMGMATPDGIYKLMRDIAKAKDLDPDRYIQRPREDIFAGPKLSGEEVISMILGGQIPDGQPLEASAEEHLKKLMEFVQSDQVGLMAEHQVQVLVMWMKKVQASDQQIQQRQAMMQAAEQMQGNINGGGGPGGAPTTIQPPADQTGAAPTAQPPGPGGGGEA